MAANLQRRGFLKFGKQLALPNRAFLPARDPAAVSAHRGRRGAHCSASDYDKNVEDQVRPAVVPDDVIETQSDKYWAPHPRTGVFGPAELAGADAASASSAPPTDGSVLEQQAWFRPLENTDKPQQPI